MKRFQWKEAGGEVGLTEVKERAVRDQREERFVSRIKGTAGETALKTPPKNLQKALTSCHARKHEANLQRSRSNDNLPAHLPPGI